MTVRPPPKPQGLLKPRRDLLVLKPRGPGL
jgi:hypothetical protein